MVEGSNNRPSEWEPNALAAALRGFTVNNRKKAFCCGQRRNTNMPGHVAPWQDILHVCVSAGISWNFLEFCKNITTPVIFKPVLKEVIID